MEQKGWADGRVVMGDAGRLGQLFLILPDNAVSYSQEKGSAIVQASEPPEGRAPLIETVGGHGYRINEEAEIG